MISFSALQFLSRTYKSFTHTIFSLLIGLHIGIFQYTYTSDVALQFKQAGYAELHSCTHGTSDFDSLYNHFDKMIEFLTKNAQWANKLHRATNCFIQSKDVHYYSTDFFGFYDESEVIQRHQISFYYSTHFHNFLYCRFPEFKKVSEITLFLESCQKIQEPYGAVFEKTAKDLHLEKIFSSTYNQPPLLLKVVKYLPNYTPIKPHYDGSTFSLFLDSTDNLALLLCPYKNSFTCADFCPAVRKLSRCLHNTSMIIIPGTLLTEFSIYPTAHIVMQSNHIRYATIAFAMRPHHKSPKNTLTPLPFFKQ